MEVIIEYDDHPEEVVEKINKLLKERNLKFEEKWEDVNLCLSIVEIEDLYLKGIMDKE